MLAKVKFLEDRIITKEEADSLGLEYIEQCLFGMRNGKLEHMKYARDAYKDELLEAFIKDEQGEYKNVYKDRETDEVMEDCYIYDRLEDNKDYVLIEEIQVADIELLVRHYPNKFTISKLYNEELPATLEKEDYSLSIKTLSHIRESLPKKEDQYIDIKTISKINKIMTLSNGYTDTLQDKLEKGWKILSVYVIQGQQRPDYILGKYEE